MKPDSTEVIARDIARKHCHESDWEAYHPWVKATIEWLHDNGYLIIVDSWEEE